MLKSLSSSKALRIIDMLNESNMSLTEISKALAVKKPTASKYLARMEDEGLISSQTRTTDVGRERIFKLEPFSLVFSIDPQNGVLLFYRSDERVDLELPLLGQIKQNEFRKASGIYAKKIINETKVKNISIIIFGSVAKGNAGRKSDIDLLLLSDSWNKSLKDGIFSIISDAAIEAEVQAKPLFWTYKEFKTKNDNFAKQIKQDGVIIYERRGDKSIWQNLEKYKSIKP